MTLGAAPVLKIGSMKVGIYLGDQSPDTGGGYTFQADLFHAFSRLVSESQHRFMVFGREEHRESVLTATSNRVGFSSLPKRTPVDRIQFMLQRDMSFARAHWRRKGWLQRQAEQEDIECMWFLGSDCHLLDMPYIAVVWDLQHRTLPWFPEVAYQGEWDAREAANAWFLRRATAVITGTRAGADEVMRFYQIQPNVLKILPHPTPSAALRAAKAGPRDSESDVLGKYGIGRPYLIYPAQFWAHKNHVTLLDAVSRLRQQGIQLDVVFTGSDKGNRPYCERVSRELGLTEFVHFLGFVPADDLISLYRYAVALAYVSHGGPENLPPLEAFALGCPVLAANVPGAHEQLGDCVLYLNPHSAESIAEACRQILDDSGLRERLTLAGRERAQKWTGEDFVRGVFAILDDIEPMRRTWGVP